MRPDKLTLRNIGPFLGTHTVNFTELGSIFLVYGKTGAGKTTLFDALSYAFYSDAPGGRKGLARQMRSHFASDTDESVVELEFTLAGRRWRIRRTLPVDRLGPRNGKLQTVAEEVTFEQYTDGAWQNRTSTNKSETDRKILDLIGLSEAEFSRIVLLPQGEFSQFLKQNSTERKEVLAKLFPVARYTRVTALARERSREEETRLKDTHAAIEALAQNFNRLAYDGDRATCALETARLREAQTVLRRELGEKSALLEQARAVAAKKEQHRVLGRHFEELEQRLPEIEQLGAGLERSRRAEPLLVRWNQISLAEERRTQLDENLDSVARDLDAGRAALARLEAESGRMEELKDEKDALLLRKEQLRVACDIAIGLESEKTVLAETLRKLAAKKKELAGITEEAAAHAARLKGLEGEVSLLDERTAEHNRARETLERLRQLKILADDHDRDRRAIAAHTEAVANRRKEIDLNLHDGEIAAAELAVLEAEEKETKTGELAGSLAVLLAEGTPCPVCGSTVHPAPAVAGAAGHFALAERIAAAERRIEQLESQETGLGKTLARCEADLRNAEDRLALTVEKYCGTGNACISADEIPSPDEATARVRSAAAAMQEAADAFARSQKAFRESAEIRRVAALLDGHAVLVAADLDAVKTAAAEQKTAIAHKEARYREAFPAQSGAVPDPADAAETLEQVSSRILGIEADIGNHDAALGDAHRSCAALSGKKTEMESSLAVLAAQLETEQAAFARDCTKAGFADGAAVSAASRTDAEKRQAEERIAAFGEDRAGSKKRLNELEGEIAHWTGPDPETAQADIAALDGRLAETDRALEERSAALSSLDSLKNRWDALEKERAERTAASGLLSSLSADLNGSNPLKTTFDAWILGMYLEEITAYANTRLERMSEGRYRIQLNDTYRRGNSLSGLELEIRDAYTGKTRPSGTLSGGETFMTSISLALGLADSIQSRSGGIQLDAVFIDEGFGSLDESSLERAIGILDEIRGTRMVGIISHVAELRTRIPNRIEIVKTGAGSTIRKETYND